MTRRRSLLASFGYGVLIAAGTAASLLGVHHALAPPAADVAAGSVHPKPTTTPRESAATTPSAERWDSFGLVTVSRPVSPASSPTPVTAVDMKPLAGSSGEAHRSLALGIQRELRRVGCFSGEPSGEWTATTIAAMKAFNDAIRVQLPTTAPDYILLTLLQGHPGEACTSTEGTTAAKATVPRAPQRREAALPFAASRPTASTRQSVTPTATPAPPPATTAVVIPTGAPTQIPTVTPLPGRMAVGAPPARIEVPQQVQSEPDSWSRNQRAVAMPAPQDEPAPRAERVERRPVALVQPSDRRAFAAPAYAPPPPRRARSPMNAGFFTGVSRNSP